MPRSTLVVAVLGLLAQSACDMPQLPGDEVGSYAISGVLLENTCGREAVPAADPLEFEAQVRNEDGQGYWVTHPPPIPGRLMPDGEFSFRFDSAVDVRDPDAAEVALEEPEDFADPERFDEQPQEALCRLRIDESISGRLLRTADADELEAPDAGGGEHDLEGVNEIEIRAMSGADCDRVVASRGGPFAELPCQVRYDITGELVTP